MDILIQRSGTDTMDIVFENGKCPMTSDYTDSVIQRLYIRLRTLMGDWYLNEEYGVPWLERILGHKVRKQTVDMIIQEQILLDSGVKSITRFSSNLNKDTRVYECSFSVQVKSGEIAEMSISSI